MLARAPAEEVCLQGLLGELQRECACEGSCRTCACEGSCRGSVLTRAPRGAAEGVCLRGLLEDVCLQGLLREQGSEDGDQLQGWKRSGCRAGAVEQEL